MKFRQKPLAVNLIHQPSKDLIVRHAGVSEASQAIARGGFEGNSRGHYVRYAVPYPINVSTDDSRVYGGN